MAFYHTVPTYLSNYGQVTKNGDPRSPVSTHRSPLTLTPTMYSIYQPDTNPRGLGPVQPNVSCLCLRSTPSF